MGVLVSECVVFIDRPLCDLPSAKRYRLESTVLRRRSIIRSNDVAWTTPGAEKILLFLSQPRLETFKILNFLFVLSLWKLLR
jgi:hypothetical protein